MIRTAFSQLPDEEPGSSNWTEQMTEAGRQLAASRVRRVIFAHGTFAGDDPFGLNTFLGRLSAATGVQLFKVDQLKRLTKHVIDLLTKDSANFTEQYIQSFASVLPDSINCLPFVWSGANHHQARLAGTVRLCNLLAGLAETVQQGDRILLMGHSHAGQVFALLTTLLGRDDKAEELLAVVDHAKGMDAALLEEQLKMINGFHLDIVTFGTPVRYCWGRYEHFRLLSIVNDRGNNVDLSGLLTTRDGDYIQQWGIEGTDLFSERHHELNKMLDTVLRNRWHVGPAEFLGRLEEKQRREPLFYDGSTVTETVLVDYQDQDSDDSTVLASLMDLDIIPHCISTLFGHGIYTRHRAMLFNTRLVLRFFYPNQNS